MKEKCPKCGADQTNKAWFVGRLRLDGLYDAVCWNCKEPNMQMHRSHVDDLLDWHKDRGRRHSESIMQDSDD